MNRIQGSVIVKEWIMLLAWSFWFFEMKKNLFGSSFACSMKYSPKARILNAQPIPFLPPDWVRINQSNDSIWIPMWKLFFENDGGTINRLWCSQAADCQQISRCWWTRSRSMESCFRKGKPFNSHTAFKMSFCPWFPSLGGLPRTGTGADEVEIAEKWLVCLYIDVLPIQTTLRIWDCLLYEGHKVIFRVALALFGIRSERVRESKNLPDFVDALNHFHQDKRVVNCHHFMSVSNYYVYKSSLLIIL